MADQNWQSFQEHLYEWKVLYLDSKFVPKGPIDNNSAWVQVMAWRQTGDMPLPEPMMT